jgi:peroxiredoxin
MLSLLLLIACTKDQPAPPPPVTQDTSPPEDTQTGDTQDSKADTAETGDTQDTQDTHDTGDTAPPGVELPDHCTPPETSLVSPISWMGEVQQSEGDGDRWFMELVDLAPGDDDVIWGAGQGGVIALDASDAANPAIHGWFPPGETPGRYYKVLPVPGEDVVFATNRDRGLDAFGVEDVAHPTVLDTLEAVGLEGMALVPGADRLLVASLRGELQVYDISDPSDVTLTATLTGLAHAWNVVVSGDRAYVADNRQGVVVVDISDPDAPTRSGDRLLGGGAQDLAVGDGALYVAAGGGGLVVLDLADPDAPAIVESHAYGGAVQDVVVDGTTLWAVNREDVIALDVTDPLDPLPLGTRRTTEFAMTVTAHGGSAWVGDWTRFSAWQVDASARVPDLDVDIDTLLFDEAGGVGRLKLTNTGGSALTLAGGQVDVEGFTLAVDTLELAPGESTRLWVTYDGGADLDATLCLATDDPDIPQTEITLHTGAAGAFDKIGKPAEDFTLTGIDGVDYTLSSQLGHPVVLVYFATWCPQCASHTSNIDSQLYQAYKAQGVQVWGIVSREPRETAISYAEHFGLSFPILLDGDGRVFDDYNLGMPFPTGAYPQDWIVGTDGTIVYANNTFSPDAMINVLDQQLGLTAPE